MNRATSIALRGPRAVLSVPAAATTARRSRWSTAANAALTASSSPSAAAIPDAVAVQPTKRSSDR